MNTITKYIAALIHNPNVINFCSYCNTDTKNNLVAESSLSLLIWSKFLSKRQKLSSSVWNMSYTIENTIYPPFHNLYTFITRREIDEFDRAEIFKHFRKEIYFLRWVYKNVEPDKEIMNQKTMIVDLFGFVHENY